MEEYSGAKIYKIKPELRNRNVNADYFYSSVGIFESVARCTEFVHDKTRINWHVNTNRIGYVCFQLRILDLMQVYF